MLRKLFVLGAPLLLSVGCLGSASDQPDADVNEDDPDTDLTGVEPSDLAFPDMTQQYDLAGGSPSAAGTLTVTAPATANIRLNETLALDVTVTPSADFAGQFFLTAEGLPDKSSFKSIPPAANVTGGTPVKFKLLIQVAADAAGAKNVPLTIKATSGSIVGSAPLSAMFGYGASGALELLLTIPRGVPINVTNNLAFYDKNGGEPTVYYLKPNTKITFANGDDLRPHSIHVNTGSTGYAGGPTYSSVGFIHEPNANITQMPMAPAVYDAEGNVTKAGGTFTETITLPDTVNQDYLLQFNCHIHSNMKGKILLKIVP